MSKRLKQIRAGRLVSAVVYTAPSAGDSTKVRAQKQRASTAAREKLNARTSFQKLERALAANFDDGDLYVTLTYDDKHLPDSRSAAVRRIGFFLRKLRAARKDRGQSLAYIYITEGCFPGGRLHHHIILNSTGMDMEEIKRLWIYGDNVEVRRLTFSQDYTYEDLANYLTKEPRDWGHPRVGEKTWTPSHNLNHPEAETDIVPDYVTLIAPPGAIVLVNEGPIRNGYGEFTWIKYLLPKQPKSRRRAKRRRKKE